jgi:hypothetical protein
MLDGLRTAHAATAMAFSQWRNREYLNHNIIGIHIYVRIISVQTYSIFTIRDAIPHNHYAYIIWYASMPPRERAGRYSISRHIPTISGLSVIYIDKTKHYRFHDIRCMYGPNITYTSASLHTFGG